MLEMSAVAAVGGYGGPLVFEHAGSRLAGIHHRLYCQHHAFTQTRAMSAGSEVWNLRLFMQPGSNAVTHELTHHTEAVGFNKLLHRGPHISDSIADASRLDAPVQRSLRNFQQLAQFLGNRIVHCNRDRGVAVVAILHHAAIDGNNVASPKHPLFRGDAMNDFLIHRGAQHAGIVEISLKCGLRAQLLHPPLGSTLQNHGGHARRHQGADVIENVTNDAATAPHFLDLRRRFADDGHSLTAVGGAPHFHGAMALNHPENLLRYLISWQVTIHGNQPSFALVVIHHGPGLQLVCLQTFPDYFLAIIVANHQLGTINIAGIGDAGWLEIDVIDVSTSETGPTSGEPAQ